MSELVAAQSISPALSLAVAIGAGAIRVGTPFVYVSVGECLT